MLSSAKLRRVVPYAIIFAIGGYLYYSAFHFDYERVSGRIGPGAWPRLILVLLMAICAYQALRLAVSRGDGAIEGVLQSLEEEADPTLIDAPTEHHSARVWLGILFTFTYIFAFQIVGFFLGSLVYLTALMFVGGYRRLVPMLTVSLAASVAFMFVFMKIVYVSLPVGRGPFLTLSVAVMRLLGIH